MKTQIAFQQKGTKVENDVECVGSLSGVQSKWLEENTA
jgi:hypothetical protein